MSKRPCNQKQCTHFHEGTCQPCESCKAEPLVIENTCAHCLRCENVPAQLRWDDPNMTEEEIKLQQEMAEMHQMMVEMMIAEAMQEDNQDTNNKVEIIVKP